MRRARARVLATVVAGTMALTGLTGLAVVAKGIPVRSIEGMDSGVWVTKDRDGIFGRQNKTARTLDGGFYASSQARDTSLDIAQDGATVVAYDRERATLYAVDTELGRPVDGGKVSVAPGSILDLRGGTIAVLDPATGQIRASRYTPDEPIPVLSDLESESSEAIASVTGNAAPGKRPTGGSDLVVTERGVVIAVDHTGKRVRVPVEEDGGFGKPQISTTGKHPQPRLGAVGDHVVLVDPQAKTVQIDDGAPVRIDGDDPLPQTPGPDRPMALVSTTSSLVSVPLSGGRPQVVFDRGAGRAGAPLVIGDCSYAAWAGAPGTVAQACGDQPPAELGMPRGKTLSKPVFRSNRGYVVLNDLDSGQIYDPGTEQVMDDWINIMKPVDPRSKQKEREQVDSKQKPEASPDDMRARAGRTTVLHLLDNDRDPGGGVLSIVKLEPKGTKDWRATISPDGQTVAFEMVKETKRAQFTYHVDNGRGGTAKASATVRPVSKGSNKAPAPLDTFGTRTPTTVAGGRIVIPVTPDWRDADGDPVTVRNVKTGASGAVSITPDGTSVDFTADPKSSGPVKVDLEVADDRRKSTKRAITVHVQGEGVQTTVRPVAMPDVARGVVKVPVVVSPLANDTSGLDPDAPQADLELVGQAGVADKDDADKLEVTTDLGTGRVMVVAKKAGSYLLDYSVVTGSAPRADGKIRVDITDAAAETQPVAMPDTAVVRGQSPASIDVIANDADPGGRVLTVTGVDAGDAPVQAVVVGGRWLRLTPTGAGKSTSGSVRYTVTNGAAKPVTAEVSVNLLGPVFPDVPVTTDDEATVRAGDAVRLSVLDNDTTAGGAPLSLLPTVDGAPGVGELAVTDAADPQAKDVGAAYVAGSDILYVAPASVTHKRTVIIDYVAQTPGLERAGGHAIVRISPVPSAGAENQPPEPDGVEARTDAGETIAIPIPGSGQDPDGDSTIVTGLASPPTLGRVLGFSPNSVTYQAYPQGQTGTDSFEVTVADRFGGTGKANVRVAVATPGEPQPALPVADSITAAPGASVTVVPAENDLVARGDPVTLRPLAQTNKRLAKGASLSHDGKVIAARAPGKDADPLTINYALNGIGGTSTVSTVTIGSQEGYRNPPRVYDVVAKAGSGGSASVDLLARAYDPDGDSTKLEVDIPGAAAGVTVSAGKATVPLTAAAQAIPFTVADESGAKSAAVIYAPPAGSGGPHFRSDKGPIVVQPEAKRTVALADYVASPSGKTLRLADTRHNLVTSPEKTVAGAKATSKPDQFTVSGGKQAGPGAVVAEVVEGAEKTSVWVSIPVQVGDPGPLLQCPDNEFPVPQGGVPLRLPITELCHVWLADPAELRAQKYDAQWDGPGLDGVEIGGNGTDTIVLTAAGSATKGRAKLKVTASGTTSSAVLTVSAEAAPPATLAAIARERVRAGEAVTIDVSDYLSSPLTNPVVEVTELRLLSGSAGHEISGSRIRLTPGNDASGQISFALAAKDARDAAPDRWARSTVTLDVFGKPDPPTGVVPVDTAINGAVQLEWTPGAANGSPIDYYEVEGAGTQRCAASPCSITGLDTGTETTFRVRAHNEAGFSDWSSPSPPVTVDVKPGAPGVPQVTDVGDGYVNLAWPPAPSEGSEVTGYEVSWAGGRVKTSGSATSARAGNLDNNRSYDFCVAAVNQAGTGPQACRGGQSAGTPAPPAISVQDAGAGNVSVSWTDVLPNGPGPVTYALTVDGSEIYSGPVTSAPYAAGLGIAHEYSVRATNAAGNSSTSAPVQYTVVGTPDPWASTPAITAGDRLITLGQIDYPRANGSEAKLSVTIGGKVVLNESVGTDGGTFTGREFGGLTNGQPYEVLLSLCNEERCSHAGSITVTPSGPVELSNPSATSTTPGLIDVSASASGGGNPARFTVTFDADEVYSSDCSTTCSINQSFPATPGSDVVVTIAIAYLDDRQSSAIKVTVAEEEPPLPHVVHAGLVPAEDIENCDGETPCNQLRVWIENYAEPVTCQVVEYDGTAHGLTPQTVGSGPSPVPLGYITGGGAVVQCGDTKDET